MNRVLAVPAVSQVARANEGMLREAVTPWVAQAAAFGIPLLFYLRTLAPTVFGMDSAELTLAAYVLGNAHPPGYPTYLLVGHVFSWLPFGDVAYRLNFMSAFFGALACWLVYRVTIATGIDELLALGATLGFGLSYYFWINATTAEVYTLHASFLAALVMLLLPADSRTRARRLPLAAIFFSLSLGNHLLTAMLVPGLAVLALWPDPRRIIGRKMVFFLTGLVVLGASVYLYLPLRAAHDSGMPAGYIDASGTFTPINLSSLQGFIYMLTIEPFRHLLFGHTPLEVLGEIGRAWGWTSSNLLGVGIPVGLLGFYQQLQQDRRLAIGLALIFACNLLFLATYAAGDTFYMLAPAMLVWVVWIAWGARELVALLMRMGSVYQRFARAIVVGSLFSLAGAAALVNFTAADMSNQWGPRSRAESILSEVDGDALVVLSWVSDLGLLRYMQVVEGMRPDVRLVPLWQISSTDLGALLDHEIDRRPIYWLGNPPSEFDAASMSSVFGHRLLQPPAPHSDWTDPSSELREAPGAATASE